MLYLKGFGLVFLASAILVAVWIALKYLWDNKPSVLDSALHVVVGLFALNGMAEFFLGDFVLKYLDRETAATFFVISLIALPVVLYTLYQRKDSVRSTNLTLFFCRRNLIPTDEEEERKFWKAHDNAMKLTFNRIEGGD